eukprot:gene7984-8841_t
MKLFFVILAQFLAGGMVSCSGNRIAKNEVSQIHFELKHLTKSVRNIIKQYGKIHSVYKAFNFPRVDLAAKCSGKIKSSYTPNRVRAAEIIKVLQEFVSKAQQMQMDEINLPKGSKSLTKNVRLLEYKLRDFTEHSFRTMIRKGMGSIVVAYSVGNLPGKQRPWLTADGMRKIHLMDLYQMLHCLTHVRRATTTIWRGFAFKNSTKHRFANF